MAALVIICLTRSKTEKTFLSTVRDANMHAGKKLVGKFWNHALQLISKNTSKKFVESQNRSKNECRILWNRYRDLLTTTHTLPQTMRIGSKRRGKVERLWENGMLCFRWPLNKGLGPVPTILTLPCPSAGDQTCLTVCHVSA